MGSIPWPVKSDAVSSTAYNCCDVSWELCCPALSSRYGCSHSSHASAYYYEYNEGLILITRNGIVHNQ